LKEERLKEERLKEERIIEERENPDSPDSYRGGKEERK
jgi:hypothetical protein